MTPTSRKPRATLTEVANRAGVSTTTASLVLGGKADQHRISEETYRRVKQAADDLDYSPNLLVRSMQRGQTHVLSFFNAFRHREIDDIYMDRLSTAIETAGGRHGYDILVHCDFSRSPKETYRFLNGGRADGLLLFAPRHDDPLLPLLRASRLPVVLINACDDELVLPSVKDDVAMGMREVADRLVNLGHRRIVAVMEEGFSVGDAAERVRLLRSLLEERGVELPDDWVARSSASARPVLEELMSRPAPPTALFCWRDFAAYNVLEACESLGISVPEQLSVIGYDGIHWPAATRHVAASVAVDLGAVAEAAVSLLNQCIMGYNGPVVQQFLPVTLTTGTTLGPPPAASTTRPAERRNR